ncbi:hypothetical protein [Nocardioides sambongensis]|uniref:hypothetical protein n=1 Tax=Nocardioides sambongensis TaxID=2589074 RepID=UPI00112BC2DF|nr:hypothetical protein [Nocardioides sambongensis]
MSVNPYLDDLMSFITQAKTPQRVLSDIEIVDEEIRGVISQVQEELEQNERQTFRREGEISETSFGGGDYASSLGIHHTRAYQVVDETLGGVETDLQDFVAACQQARDILTESDAQAAEDFTLVTEFISAIDSGTHGSNTQHANENAQQHPGGDL